LSCISGGLRKLKTDLEYVKKELGLTIDDILNEEIVGDNDVVALAADGEKVENANYYIFNISSIVSPNSFFTYSRSVFNLRKSSIAGWHNSVISVLYGSVCKN